MPDSPISAHRSWTMSRIRSTNTKPEIALRSVLHRMGFRFSIHRNDLPGKPDIVLPKYQTVVFVHGCFWHRHPGCKRSSTPKTRQKFWEEKFSKNIRRDIQNQNALKADGWTVIVCWECEIEQDPPGVGLNIAKRLKPEADQSLFHPLPSKQHILKAAEQRVHYGIRKPS